MNIILWLIAGAVIGYIASRIMGTNSQQGLLLDIVVGVVGAFLAGWFLTPLFGIATINQNDFSLPALLVSLLGAVILLAIFKVFRGRGRVFR
ncbi:MAG: GlsB/YeaQ/YmgE family stress response membrane protein [Chloroflexi bacterium]|nr:MAG: GlsB/YeaQ/YmgE family stress response membrane protein [Chloroflexota bacterium]